eukprot:gene6848-4293_t
MWIHVVVVAVMMIAHNFIIVKEARTGSGMIHEYLKSHPDVGISWEVGTSYERISEALQCSKPVCGCDTWQDVPIARLEALALKHDAVVIVLLRYDHFASARSLMKIDQAFSLNEFKNYVALFKSSRMRMTALLQHTRILSYVIIYEDFILNRQESLHTLQRHIGLVPMRLAGEAHNKIARWEFTGEQRATLNEYEARYGRNKPVIDAQREVALICRGAVGGGRYLRWRGSRWDTTPVEVVSSMPETMVAGALRSVAPGAAIAGDWKKHNRTGGALAAARATVVVSSLYRPGTLVRDALRSMARCPALNGNIHVYGYNPVHANPAVTGHKMPASPFHNAYRWLHTNFAARVPTNALASCDKNAHADTLTRAFWRTSLNLDAWAALSDARLRGVSDIVVWIENDGFVRDCGAMDRALRQFAKSGNDGAACYGVEGATYMGSGAVCMMFLRSTLQDILAHVLGYHMVQPFDWILSDYARHNRWTTYNVVQHGHSRNNHMSTLIE